MIPRWANGSSAGSVSTLLEAVSRASGQPGRLTESRGISYIGCFVLGMGFVITPEEARGWIDADPENADVLFPYLNGEDLNSRPDLSATRWVIDFNDRSEEEARRYALPFEHAAAVVRPERQRLAPSGGFALRKPLPQRWWQFADKRPGLRAATAKLDEVLAIALVSKTVMPLRVPTGQIFSHRLAVFATDSYALQAVLSSSIAFSWAVKYSSTLETRVNYSPSDAFETFPSPAESPALDAIGRELDETRREIMLRRDLGLTKLYNLINDPDVAHDPDVETMRDIHVRLDHTVMDAYGWSDVLLNHGFHTYRQMQRWTVSPQAREEILDRLLEENHRRYTQDNEVGLSCAPG